MPKRNESTPTQKLSTGVHSSIVPDNQKVKTTQYTYNEITIERNEVLTPPTVCMNLEYTCLRKEVSHKDHILHDYIYKKCLGLPLVAQMVKHPPAIWDTWVQSLGWEDPLAKGMATHSNILAWRIPMDRGAWRTTVCGVTESEMTEQ